MYFLFYLSVTSLLRDDPLRCFMVINEIKFFLGAIIFQTTINIICLFLNIFFVLLENWAGKYQSHIR